MRTLYICKIIIDINCGTEMLFLSVPVFKRHSEPCKERLSVFLENVGQEMPKAHLELLHSGSLCVTTEAFGALLA